MHKSPPVIPTATKPDANDRADVENQAPVHPAPAEIGGRPGPDPTRYGDWEKDGRCIDF